MISNNKLRTVHTQSEGMLTYIEAFIDIPFIPARVFYVTGAKKDTKRGGHAHFTLQEFLICLKGSIEVVIDNGRKRDKHVLESPLNGLYVPCMCWVDIFFVEHNSILLACASDLYKPEDYIRDYNEFIKLTTKDVMI